MTKIVIGKTKFMPSGATVEFTRFADNNAPCIIITRDGEMECRASVNGDFGLTDSQTCIKDWSENEGVLKALVAAGVVTPTDRTVECGFVEASVCEINPDYLDRLPPLENAA